MCKNKKKKSGKVEKNSWYLGTRLNDPALIDLNRGFSSCSNASREDIFFCNRKYRCGMVLLAELEEKIHFSISNNSRILLELRSLVSSKWRLFASASNEFDETQVRVLDR